MANFQLIIAALFLIFSLPSQASIWPNGSGVYVASPADAKVSYSDAVAAMSSAYDSASGGAKARGSINLSVAGRSVLGNISKAVPPGSIASTMATCMMNKTACALTGIAIGLQFYNMVDGSLQHQVPGTSTSPTNPYEINANWLPVTSQPNACYGAGKYYYAAGQTEYVITTNFSYNQSGNPGYNMGYGYYNGGCGLYAFKRSLSTPTAQCNTGYSYDPTQKKCYYTNSMCTPPSTYDSVTKMCVGSAINEPANAAQLEADIASTMSGDTSHIKAPSFLDELLDQGFIPSSTAPTKTDQATPNAITTAPTTETQSYTDPATSHPTTRTTTKADTYSIAPTADATGYDVTRTTQSTTQTTDNVTGVTTTSTSTTTAGGSTYQQPAEQVEQKTDCDKYPDTIGCSKYGTTPTPEVLPTQSAPISITPAFGTDGVCPSPQVISTSHGSLTIPWQPTCDFAAKARPLILAFAWLVAGGMLVGSARRAF